MLLLPPPLLRDRFRFVFPSFFGVLTVLVLRVPNSKLPLLLPPRRPQTRRFEQEERERQFCFVLKRICF